MNDTFFKLRLLNEFLVESQARRSMLLEELIDNATDPVVKKRRFRMLSNLAAYEASIIKKIANFDTDDIHDLLLFQSLSDELDSLLDRSA